MPLEIKVVCDCGQKYKFEVEPVNGLMTFPVHCPVCGAEGTQKANTLIAQALAARPPAPVFAPAPRPVAIATAAPVAAPVPFAVAPPPVAAPVGAPPPPPPVEAPRLRINAAAPAAAPTEGAAPPPVPVARPPFGAVRPPAAPAAKEIGMKGNFGLGILGAALGGIVGMILWFLLIKATGYEIGYAAWGVGVLAGVGARLFCREGSTALGAVAGLCALLAVVGGEFLYAKSIVDKVLDDNEKSFAKAYDERMAYAKDAVKAKSDDEIKAVLIKHEGNETPTADDIKEFRESELPALKEFASGKPTRAEFEKSLHVIDRGGLAYNMLLLFNCVGLFTLLWLALGVSTAFKIGSG